MDYKDDLLVYEEFKEFGWGNGGNVDIFENYYRYFSEMRDGILGLVVFKEGYYKNLKEIFVR